MEPVVSKIDVHADLFNFMMTGRCGVAVAEYLGSRLTGRVSPDVCIFARGIQLNASAQ